MATAPELHEPHIAAARAQAWHQAGEPLLTLEAARIWLNEFGLVLFAPRGASLGAPAPSLVEATLGEARNTVALADTETARSLTARLIGEGSALPLNLLGGPGDVPDFVVSAAAFPFVFTLRGDKGWKRPPETVGAVKVTPLGLRVYELLAEKGALTIAAVVSEVGREVTESAVARALSELWQMLRVFPAVGQGVGETVWELTTTRFLKAVKAGSNAGQPTALSAVASLYLTQVYVATEEEIAGFMSPLTARSRVRDVVHGLSAGRQLAEGVISGKTVLYMPDALPDFAEFAEPDEIEAEESAAEDEETDEGIDADTEDIEREDGETLVAEIPGGEEGTPSDAPPQERIRRFEGGDGAGAKERNLRGKPVRREGAGDQARGPKRPPSDRPRREGFAAGGRADRGGSERRPYVPRTERPGRSDGPSDRPTRSFRPAGERPSFNRPWEEDRANRPSRPEGERPARPFRSRPEGGDRPFRPRPEGGDRPLRPRTEGGDRSFRPRPATGDRPSRPRSEGGDRPFRPRTEGGDRPFRPRTEGGDRSFRPRTEGGDRPFRPRTEGGDRPYRPRPASGDRSFRPRTEGGDRPFRPRPEGGDRPFRPRTEGVDRPFRPREGGAPREGGFRDRRAPGGPPSSRFGGDRPKSFGNRAPREGGEGDRRPSRPTFGGPGSGEGRLPRGDRPPSRFGAPKGPRSGPPGGGGGFRGGPKKPGAKFAGRTDRPDRPARKPRPEDEA